MRDLEIKKYTFTPLKDEELLLMFPEAKAIIPQKIDEYQFERADLMQKMRTFRGEVKQIADKANKDEFFVWFWGYAYLKYFHVPKVVLIDKRLRRLHYQKRLLHKNAENPNIDNQCNWEELKEKAKSVSLVEIATPYLEKIRQTSSRITAVCPFHKEKTPSFIIYLESNSFHCFGCQANGDVIDFKIKIENQTFQEAVKELAI